MSEPEEVILDGAHAATEFVARFWRRNAAGAPVLGLSDTRRRLELLVTAFGGQMLPIVGAQAAARPTLFGRLARRTPAHLVDLRALPSTDGVRIRLPPQLDAAHGTVAAATRYRLLVLIQAARAARGAPRLLPPAADVLARELYQLSESAAADRLLVAELPGLAGEMQAARTAERGMRPPASSLTPCEREVERLLDLVLASRPDTIPSELPDADTAAASLAWARDTAEELTARFGRFRGCRAVSLWGRIQPPPADPEHRRMPVPDDSALPTPMGRVRLLTRRPRVRDAPDDEDDPQMGMWMVQIDDPKEHVEDPMGLQRPADTDTDADADDLADSVSELEEARLAAVPGAPTEVLVSDDPPDRRAIDAHPTRTGVGVEYPEWDYRIGAYRAGHALIRERLAVPGDQAWAADVRRRYASEIAEVRRRFERLRAQRERLVRQLDGDDLDLGAFVTAWADARAGGASDDRLYERVRPGRRDVAVSLLVDVSGSTDSWIADQRRIIDVEKEALVLVCEALDALGDRYNLLAFSGEGARGVDLRLLKGFTEPYGQAVRERIAGLEHDRYTRLGSAIRHTTAALCREHARHRLLLVLSDGKPNDVDIYEGRYGIEDARQAVVEARLQGLSTFCLTVDREAPVYLPRIFGANGYAVLRKAERLPTVLVEVVRQLLQG
jgi:nitric oxide reductase NorD protein